jgi:hypothetical protein
MKLDERINKRRGLEIGFAALLRKQHPDLSAEEALRIASMPGWGTPARKRIVLGLPPFVPPQE